MSKTLVIKETRTYRIKDIDKVNVYDYEGFEPISIKELGINSMDDIADYDKYNKFVFNKGYSIVLDDTEDHCKSTEFEVFDADEHDKQFAYEHDFSDSSNFITHQNIR